MACMYKSTACCKLTFDHMYTGVTCSSAFAGMYTAWLDTLPHTNIISSFNVLKSGIMMLGSWQKLQGHVLCIDFLMVKLLHKSLPIINGCQNLTWKSHNYMC